MSGSEGPLYALATVGNLVDLDADQSLDDAPDERPGIAAPEEIAGEPGRDAVRSSAAQRRQPPPPGLERAVQLGGFLEGRLDGGGRQLPRNPLGRQLLTEPETADAAPPGPSLGPPAGKGLIVQIAAGLELGHDGPGDIGGGAPPAEAPGEFARAPGLARQQVEGRKLRGFRVENRPVSARPRATRPGPGHPYCARWGARPPFRTLPPGGWRGQNPRATRNTGREMTWSRTAGTLNVYFFRKCELDDWPWVGAAAGGAAGAAVSQVISPVERMPLTFRSKSSGLVAASRAVS